MRIPWCSFPSRTAGLAAWLSPLPILLALLAVPEVGSAAIDYSINQTTWKLLYGVTDTQINDPAWLAKDDDGDGLSNGSEMAAGTNPFKANSVIAFSAVTADAGGMHMTFPTVLGKLYILQTTSTLADAGSWVNASPIVQVTGDGVPHTVTAPMAGNSTFYRVLVQDVDSDGDGVSDWAEKVLGFDPASATTHAGVNDHDSIAAALPNENKISIATTKSTATQPADALSPPSDLATVTVTRSGTLLFNAITVPLTKSGTALEGVDYDSLPATVTFPARVASVSFTVNPKANTNRRSNATASFKVQPGGGYAIAGADTASVVIYPAAVPSGTGLTARYYVGSSSTYGGPANFGGTATTYTYTKSTTTTGTAVISYSGSPSLSASFPQNRINLQFTGGALGGGGYDQVCTITAATSTTITVAIFKASGVPNTQSGSAACLLNPPVVTRIDPNVDFYWYYGTPNGGTIYPNNSPDNYSAVWEGYLHPTTAGSYTFQLDADDKARVFLDLNDGNGMQQILEHNWDSAATVGVFKQSSPVTLAVPATPANRYHIRVEHVETTGDARCRLQWKVGSGSFANIPQAQVYTHTQATTYNYTKSTTTTGSAVITPTGGHSLSVGNQVNLSFSSGNLFTPTTYNGNYTVTAVNGTTTFTVAITGAAVPSSGSGSGFVGNSASTTTGLLNYTYGNTSFADPPGRVAVDAAVTAGNNGIWGSGTPDVSLVGPDYFCARWSGQVQPQYSERYYFVGRVDDGVKIWVNNQLIVNRWPGGGVTDAVGAIDLQAGVLYDIVMEYYEATGSAEAHLQWYSDSQPKQAIPTSRLYPDSTQSNSVAAAPTAVTSPITAVALVGDSSPFSYTITASNGPGTTFSATGLPAWLTLNATTGVISGSPTAAQAGHYQIVVSATNASGTGSSVVDIDVLDTGSHVTRELWTSGVTGIALANVPFGSAPTTTDATLSTLEDTTDYANNTGERLRGYFVPATTGNYYFWLAANNEAEFWMSNDAEPINKVRRAYVIAPGTTARAWSTAGQTGQKTPWLALTAGKKYYYEVLHNNGSGSTDHLSVGWLLDPTGSSAAIADGSSVVPGYPLSPYDYPSAVVATGTLYATNMAPQGSASSKGTGSANMRLSADHSQVILHFNYGGLTSPKTAYHIHCDPFGVNPSQIIYDIDDVDSFHPELRTADGGYIWNIEAVGTLSAADVVTAITTGKAYINIHSVNYPNGEIRGNFGLVEGSQSPPTPVADPGYADDHTTDAGASRFLIQATYGVDPTDLANVKSMGYSAWIDSQFAKSPTHLVPDVLANITADINSPYADYLVWNAWWKQSITAPDQLRQRMAFALSEILVISDVGPLNNNGRILADYYDTLLDFGFSNFRDILKQVTLTPAMGIYLDMRGNPKGSLVTGLHPNENYAREIMQLFSIGLNRLWPDGTLMLDSQGNLIPTYTQTEILGMARVFTGWNYGQSLQANGRLPTSFSPSANYLDPMVLVPTQHELGDKRVLDNVVLPAANGYNPIGSPVPGSEADSSVVAFDTYCLNDLEKALDSIMSNANVAPFICRQLIQRFVTSHPSSGYLQRVVAKFNDDGTVNHTKGNLQAVIKAILLDGEARDAAAARSNPVFGKQREPLIRLAGLARTFPAAGTTGTYTQGTGTASNRLDITTSTPHGLSVSSTGFLDFTGNLTQTAPPLPANNPSTTNYTVLSSPAPTATTFSVSATGMTNASYSQTSGSSSLTVNTSGPPAVAGTKVYLDFLSGTGVDGIYTVTGNPTGSSFTVDMGANTTAKSGNVLVPKIGSSYNVNTTGTAPNRTTTITVNTIGNHNLVVGNHIWFDANAAVVNGVVDGEYAVSNVIDEDHFNIVISPVTEPAPTNQSQNSNTIYPLVPPPVGRSGTIGISASTFDVRRTDSQSPTAWTDLNQTPLNSPTVFNFFYPDYKYPGTLANANVTTPEFQLTTDTSIVNVTNTITYMLIGTGGGNNTNTSGLASYPNGQGKITINLGPYQTASNTSNSGIPALVDTLSNLLIGGPLNSSTRTTIINFVANTTNFPYTTPTPTATQMRDRVRAVVHLIVTSPEYAIQK